ncbi:hypothetical protein QC281_32800 [Streptomyces sp. DH17]|nr:hypothetical protein [Streptomyces sp. DH17]
MSVFAEALLARVRAAEAGLAAAVEADDVYAVAAAQDEVDDAVRVARDHGLVPGAAAAEVEER